MKSVRPRRRVFFKCAFHLGFGLGRECYAVSTPSNLPVQHHRSNRCTDDKVLQVVSAIPCLRHDAREIYGRHGAILYRVSSCIQQAAQLM